jgi:hypothetical protein
MMPADQPVQRRSSVRFLFRLVFTFLFLLAAVWVLFNRQTVYDWVLLRFYTPPASIVQLANDASMTDKARTDFYASQPEVRGKSTFSQGCNGLNNETGNVLGCYTGTKIFIYDVTNSQLAGVKEVTAAHEMLHAAYQRLSASDKQHINDLLNQQIKIGLDASIKIVLEGYAKSEPGQELNELHSILGTEQASLSPELETYYTQYFSNRAQIVATSNAYQSVFEGLTKQRDQLYGEITTMERTINQETEALNDDSEQLKADIETFNARADKNSFASQEEFNAQRADLMARQADINERIASITALRADYTAKVATYNQLGVEFNTLNDNINSSPVEVQESIQ